MKLILAIPAFSLLCSGAFVFNNVKPAVPNQGAPPKPTVSSPHAPRMWSMNADVCKGETFDLYFAPPNPAYLGVIDPDGRFFYLVFPKEETCGNLRPVVDSERFAGMESLSIPTATLTADPYTHGVTENQPVFTKTGTYRFILGENLNVDDESTLEIVKIRYTHKERMSKPFAN